MTVPEIRPQDMQTILAALAGGTARVERVRLSDRSVWIKRYSRDGLRIFARLQAPLAALLKQPVLRPSPLKKPEGYVDREVRQIAAFSAAGFLTPAIFFRGPRALVLSHLGETVMAQMDALRDSDPQAHDALLVRCAAELGNIHAAGLCHGRPHPRDFIIDNGQFGVLDFEEDPAAVMPRETAQARDVVLLFLQIASRSRLAETSGNAFAAWRAVAPPLTQSALRQVLPLFAGFLPAARFVHRIIGGKDIARFVNAIEFLTAASAPAPDGAAPLTQNFATKAGNHE
ncbi:serine/threonine protein phosphatase [Pararhizobium sp.]|uniref:serine/threonine protein phosphatase n=1 Tax=Pararhizobium sp. TaxID=1977563 RepID=UPI0027293DDF|nr:serine/threonine protein phosphatase [Pararhizobium sp.]MDO9416425.1 serine/threonine protein phosphatase [Pararhizobium sp.]